MAISSYLRGLRRHIGHALVLMPSVVAIIRDAEGRLLIEVRSDNGLWCLPGGAIDPGESPAVAVVREVYEETGLHVAPTAIVGVFGPLQTRYPNGDAVEFTCVMIQCAVTGGTLQSGDGESVSFAWRYREDLPELGFPSAAFQWQPGQPALFDPPMSDGPRAAGDD